MFLYFFVFEEKEHVAVTVMTSSIRHLNTVGFMQSKVKKKCSFRYFILFLFFNKMSISNQWKIITFCGGLESNLSS